MFHYRETIEKVTRESAAKHMNSGITLSPPPIVDDTVSCADNKVSFEESSPPSGFVEVKKK